MWSPHSSSATDHVHAGCVFPGQVKGLDLRAPRNEYLLAPPDGLGLQFSAADRAQNQAVRPHHHLGAGVTRRRTDLVKDGGDRNILPLAQQL